MVDEHQEWEMNQESEVEPAFRETDSKGGLKWWWIVLVVAVVGVASWWIVSDRLSVEPETQQKPVEVPVTEPASPVPETPVSEEPQLTTEQAAFLQYFTEQVLTRALADQAGNWDLHAFKRLVRTAKSAEFLVDAPGMTWDRWEKERGTILEQARIVLSNPEFVAFLWERFRGPVLAAIRASDKGASVRDWCLRALPYFSGALPRSKSRVLAAYYEVDQALDREMKKDAYSEEKIRLLTLQLDKRYQAVTAAGMDQDDIYLFEFSRRRMAEGGRDLLKAYAAILEDLSQAAE